MFIPMSLLHTINQTWPPRSQRVEQHVTRESTCEKKSKQTVQHDALIKDATVKHLVLVSPNLKT